MIRKWRSMNLFQNIFILLTKCIEIEWWKSLTINLLFSEGGYGINTQVEKSKNMTIVKFMEFDLNKLFWIFVESWMW